MPGFYDLFRPLIFKADPETAHQLTLKALKSGLLPPCATIQDQALEVKLWGLKFPNPIGLSAGFDKNAEVIGPAFKMGFGFVEAGTVTPKPQPGNPRPRVFRDPKTESVINRLGFPSEGMNAFKSNLESFFDSKHRPPGVLGINIGMNKNQTEPAKDYTALINMLGPMADYITINISSPNTPGLRDLQKREPLLELARRGFERAKKILRRSSAAAAGQTRARSCRRPAGRNCENNSRGRDRRDHSLQHNAGPARLPARRFRRRERRSQWPAPRREIHRDHRQFLSSSQAVNCQSSALVESQADQTLMRRFRQALRSCSSTHRLYSGVQPWQIP
jgi:hypothetical protein